MAKNDSLVQPLIDIVQLACLWAGLSSSLYEFIYFATLHKQPGNIINLKDVFGYWQSAGVAG